MPIIAWILVRLKIRFTTVFNNCYGEDTPTVNTLCFFSHFLLGHPVEPEL